MSRSGNAAMCRLKCAVRVVAPLTFQVISAMAEFFNKHMRLSVIRSGQLPFLGLSPDVPRGTYAGNITQCYYHLIMLNRLRNASGVSALEKTLIQK